MTPPEALCLVGVHSSRIFGFCPGGYRTVQDRVCDEAERGSSCVTREGCRWLKKQRGTAALEASVISGASTSGDLRWPSPCQSLSSPSSMAVSPEICLKLLV